MRITERKVRLWDDQRLRALVTIVFENEFVVRNIKVIEGRNRRLFVAMPSRRLPDGTHVDVAHPITREYREYLEKTILAAYWEERNLYDQDPEAYRATRRFGSGASEEWEEDVDSAPPPQH
jgi:stage V sporulation protein G